MVQVCSTKNNPYPTWHVVGPRRLRVCKWLCLSSEWQLQTPILIHCFMIDDDPDYDPDYPLPQLCSPLESEVHLRLTLWDKTFKVERILQQREVAIVLLVRKVGFKAKSRRIVKLVRSRYLVPVMIGSPNGCLSSILSPQIRPHAGAPSQSREISIANFKLPLFLSAPVTSAAPQMLPSYTVPSATFQRVTDCSVLSVPSSSNILTVPPMSRLTTLPPM